MKQRVIFPAVYFNNTNRPGKRVQVLLSEKELSELPDDRQFSGNQILTAIWKYQVQHSAVGKYSVLNNFCHAKFLAYSTQANKSRKTCEYQPDEFEDNMIENNHE